MTAPIRDMAELVEALRCAQIERNISYETIDAVSGLQPGYTAKLLAPVPIKNLGPVSTFPLIGALGKALVLVDDAERIAKVKGRWKGRIIRGGARLQLRAREAASMEIAKRGETLEKQDQNGVFAFMQKIGKMGGKKSGAKRRAKSMRRRELQAKRAHAARKRWEKVRSARH